MQRSGSCSVVSKGSPSSTMLSRNWAKGVPRCSGRGARGSLQPAPRHTPPHRPASLGFCEPWRHSVRLQSVGAQPLGPWAPPPAGCGLPVVRWSVTCLLTIVCIGHCLPHGEDHGQNEGGVTEFLMVCGGAKQAVRFPQMAGTSPAGRKLPLTHPACLSACPAPAPQAAQMTLVWR